MALKVSLCYSEIWCDCFKFLSSSFWTIKFINFFKYSERYLFLTAVLLKNQVFWNKMQCYWMRSSQCFEGTAILEVSRSTGWRTKCHSIDCTHNTFLLLQKHLTSGTELILIGWKIVPNEEHIQCDHRLALQPLANEPLRLWVATTLLVSAWNNTTVTFWSTVNRPLSAILQTGDIYHIFHELQHSLGHLQHRYYDVTILMGW